MSIEFYCSSCQSLLRTGDAAVGKGARCPNCGNIEIVPETSDLTPISSEGLGNSAKESDNRPSNQAKENFFIGDNAATSNPFAGPQRPSSPHYISDSRFQAAKRQVSPPAIAMIIFSSLGLTGSGVALMALIGQAVVNGPNVGIAELAVLMAGFPFQLLILYGSISMLRLKNYGLSMTAAICSTLSGMFCCFLPAAFGIWALIVLNDRDVKRSFG